MTIQHCEASGEPCVPADQWWEAQEELERVKRLLDDQRGWPRQLGKLRHRAETLEDILIGTAKGLREAGMPSLAAKVEAWTAAAMAGTE